MQDVKIFTKNIEQSALDQINLLMNQEAFKDCKIRIMPDVHAGAGCVIGFTGDLGDKVIPNIVGVDIGCGMLCVELGKVDIDLEGLDNFIKTKIPSGFAVREGDTLLDKWRTGRAYNQYISDLFCCNSLHNLDRLCRSLGSLGGGNHFIEIDEDVLGCKYLVIHTGSRNLGKQVAEFYQDLAVKNCSNDYKLKEITDELIKVYKAAGMQKDIAHDIGKIKEVYSKLPKYPKELAYLEGTDRDKYLHDMMICTEFARENREAIMNDILTYLGTKQGLSTSGINKFHTIHNYIDENNMIRKGAIAAHEGEKVLIPMNMRDGCIIGIGKGNPDWNYSAPHGAGRIMSRMQAIRELSVEDYQKEMQGIYTTTADKGTLDEAPMAYKPMQEIIDNIGDTVEIVKIIKPIYNFKAGGE